MPGGAVCSVAELVEIIIPVGYGKVVEEGLTFPATPYVGNLLDIVFPAFPDEPHRSNLFLPTKDSSYSDDLRWVHRISQFSQVSPTDAVVIRCTRGNLNDPGFWLPDTRSNTNLLYISSI